ncbi:Carnitine O-acetyltransferase mitochondrial [Coemansia sp. Benny D115]|nr:Carnitine O-acetyltransferase mitochondrial [Coemansia sp. Benny D115]
MTTSAPSAAFAAKYPSDALPKLPVPELQDTLARFTAAAKPLFGSAEFDECLEKMEHFMANEAPVLQDRLRQRASEHVNWLEDWWNSYAYFTNRASLCFNVNYFFGFRHTPQPQSQARLAAILIDSALRFRDTLEAGDLEKDNIRGRPMCMHQYQYMFATCRHPGKESDWTEVYPREQSGHIAIAHKGRFFALRLPSRPADRYTAILHIESQLQAIIDTTEQLERCKSIGVLTAALRDDWHAARECLLEISPDNAASLHVLESSAFLLSLETTSPATHQEFSLACHCADGVNRYFDKNFQILVFANGRYGFNGEHSLTDATTDMRLCNELVKDVERLSEEIPAAQSLKTPELAAVDKYAVEELGFEFSGELLGHIQRAVDYFDATVRGHELATLVFDSFGKEQIKKMKVSPDAFVQMAMQLAYYRKFRHVPATYESASTKSYMRGRTETSRSVSEHSVEWCRMMVDHPETTGLYAKAEMLKQAIVSQSQFTAQCSKGYGIDRHLLGLEFSLLEGEARPAIFSDPVFLASRHWKLSTSQISDPILDAYGWGEVVDDGFGIAYRIENESLHFNVTSQCLGSKRLCQYLSDALMDMRFLLTNAHKQPHEIAAEVDAVANVLTSIKLLSSTATRSPPSPLSETPATANVESIAADDFRFRDAYVPPTAVSSSVVDELERLPSNEVICALETRLSRFVKESLYWALPSTS